MSFLRTGSRSFRDPIFISEVLSNLISLYYLPLPLADAQAEDISKLIEKLEQDEDVQKVIHNMG